jgi:hypothetical protein
LLRWQFRLAHELLDAAIDRLPRDAFHRRPRGLGCSPGVTYAQAVLCEDLSVNGVLGMELPLALSTWTGRTGLSELPRRPPGRPAGAPGHAGTLEQARGERPAGLLTALLFSVSMRRGEIVRLVAFRSCSGG